MKVASEIYIKAESVNHKLKLNKKQSETWKIITR